MKIEHVALWVQDIEAMREFYEKYLNAASNEKYANTTKGFCSYFLSFESGARLELMQSDNYADSVQGVSRPYPGFTHLSVSVGSRKKVDELTQRLLADGYELIDGPRVTGDGYYESCFHDPENNELEITV